MHAQNRNTAASSPGGRGPPAASSGCTGVPAAGAAAAAAARILSQGRQRVPAGTASRLRPEAWSPWPLDPSCGVPSPTTTLTGALGENPAAAPRRLAPVQDGSLAQEANPGRRGRRPERALPFFFFFPALQPENGAWRLQALCRRQIEVLSIGFPFGGIRNERLRDPKTEMLKAGLGRSCAPLSCPH